MKTNVSKPVLKIAVLSLGFAYCFNADGARPVGEGAVPVGEGTVPVGEGAVPVGEGAVPVGEGAVPVGEGAVPVGEGTVPVGEGAVPVGEGAVAVGEHAHLTSDRRARFEAAVASAKDPETADLFSGAPEKRHPAVARRLVQLVLQPAAKLSAADQAVEDARVKHDEEWAKGALTAASSQQPKLFNSSWWDANEKELNSPRFYYSGKEPATWRKHANWKDLSGTLKITTDPFYYDYGRNVVCKGAAIYVNHRPVAAYGDAATSARRLATTPPLAAGGAIRWTPLGTFVLSQNPKTQPVAIAMQLVLGDEGTISGSYYDWKTKNSETIRGRVDPDTQRVAFMVSGSKIVMEAGLANLTRDEARLWAHISDGRNPVWLLARLPEGAPGK